MCVNPGKLYRDGRSTYTLIPCGHCYDCEKKKRAMWTGRNLVEWLYNESAYFITLTYDEDKIESLEEEIQTGLRLPNISHYQKFLKRLRKKYSGNRIRYFLCHEYGPGTYRPHYHCILYFQHEVELKESNIRKLWKYGFVGCDKLTHARIHYTSKYLQKSAFRRNLVKPEHLHLYETLYDYSPEECDNMLLRYVVYKNSFIRCSREPAIGAWILEDKEFIEFVRRYHKREKSYPPLHVHGKQYPLPKYFIHKIFSDEERNEMAEEYKYQYEVDLRKEAHMYGISVPELEENKRVKQKLATERYELELERRERASEREAREKFEASVKMLNYHK